MKIVYALTAGLAGAVVLTLTHQALQKLFDDAPRMDLMGEEALQKAAHKMDIKIPKEKSYGINMAADIVANSLYYALAAIGSPKKCYTAQHCSGPRCRSQRRITTETYWSYQCIQQP